ncbi:hypothetical protein HanRHA438_Chr13g0621071 [Helianthus annuus]|nr:hypothetical protein HanRHA438_Chr13g0621071 [Helianthus annuus]
MLPHLSTVLRLLVYPILGLPRLTINIPLLYLTSNVVFQHYILHYVSFVASQRNILHFVLSVAFHINIFL